MVWIRGDDIPHMLAGEEQPLYHNQHKAGTIRVRTRTGYPDLIVVKLHNMHYIIWRDQFERVRAKDLKFAKIQERIPECWAEFRQQGVTA